MRLLETRIEPDIEGLIATIKGTAEPERVFNIELFLDPEIATLLLRLFELSVGIDETEPHAAQKRSIRLRRFLGYDTVRADIVCDIFPRRSLRASDTTRAAGQRRGERDWIDEHGGPVSSWKSFDLYPWPKVSDIDFRALEWLEKNLPRNMGCYELTAHILEQAVLLMGFENLCLLLYDDPDLVDAVFQKVGEYYLDFTRCLCDFDCLRIVWGSDDMGFRTSTMLSTEILRTKVLPWHRRCAELSHAHGKLYLLHACGRLDAIMEDLIEDVGIDAKHSFEDAIMPVTDAKRRYGGRVALLGGIDMDFLCRAPEEQIRERVRETLRACLPGGRYCLGTGNTVANYVPIDNYLAMLDEGRRYR